MTEKSYEGAQVLTESEQYLMIDSASTNALMAQLSVENKLALKTYL